MFKVGDKVKSKYKTMDESKHWYRHDPIEGIVVEIDTNVKTIKVKIPDKSSLGEYFKELWYYIEDMILIDHQKRLNRLYRRE